MAPSSDVGVCILVRAFKGVTILNSMRVEAPADPWFFPYNYYTQETFFSSCVQVNAPSPPPPPPAHPGHTVRDRQMQRPHSTRRIRLL